MITKLKLDRLAELRIEKDLLKIKKQELVDGVLTLEAKTQLAEIDDEFAPRLEAVHSKTLELEARIKEEVIVHGETIKGNLLQAVWSKARTSWDTKGLNGYLVNNPELNQFKKTGKPSVSIRKVAA